MTKNALITLCAGIGFLFMLSSCMDKGSIYKEPEPPKKGDYFDYSTTQNISVNIDYGFKDYVILFELYDEYPLIEEADGTFTKKEIEPVYRASTDKQGRYTGEVVLASYISEVWLYSDYLGAISPVKLEVKDNVVTYNQNEFIQDLNVTSRAVTSNGFNYPDGFGVIGEWNAKGAPAYMLPELNLPPAAIAYSIKETYAKSGGKTIVDYHPEFFEGNMVADITIIKPTKVKLVFINSGASFENTVGYYTYPAGSKPDPDKIKKIIAFPYTSPMYVRGEAKGPLLCGSQVELKYWDGTKYQDEFPAGVTIGWVLFPDAFKNGNIVPKYNSWNAPRFSTKELNADGKQRVVSLRDNSSNQIVAIGFEDNKDFDYCDATFYIDIEQKDAIDADLIPPLPDPVGPTEDENCTSYYGILTFEDMWPAEGDYDMNDVMISYNCTVYRRLITNRIFKIVDEFTPLHSGGVFQNGFGYQLNGLESGDVRDIAIEGPQTSSFMAGNKFEPGQSVPTIVLFDNVKSTIGEKYTVTMDFNDIDKKLSPPYNPFIIANANEGRGQEVHLVNYAPTDLADRDLLGTISDVSNSAEGLYYVSKDNMPFAIQMPNVKSLPIPEEGVRIDITFPEFTEWAKSKGKNKKDWYKHPVAN